MMKFGKMFTEDRQPTKQRSRYSQRGEGSLVMLLAVVMVIVVAALLMKLTMNETQTVRTGHVAYQYGFGQADVLLRSVSTIKEGLEPTMYGNPGLKQGISTAQVAEMNLFPTGSVSGMGVGQAVLVRNEFAGQYAISGNADAVGSVAAGDGYFIYMSDIPQEYCAFIASSLAKMANDVWVGAAIDLQLPRGNASTAISPPNASNVQSFGHPLELTGLAARCSRASKLTLVALMSIRSFD